MTSAFTLRCISCGMPLARSKWNTTTDVLFCDNIDCGNFRNPVVPPESHDLEQFSERSLKKKMQRLRRYIHSEE